MEAKSSMNLLSNKLYLEDIVLVANEDLPWDKLKNKNIIISGASGLIGSFLVDVIMYKNREEKLNCHIYALIRNTERAKVRFMPYLDDKNFTIVSHDINEVLIIEGLKQADYVLHLASNTHPKQYATDAINTITTNIIGTKNMLDFAYEHKATRFLFASSNEIYGENRGDTEKFSEDYCGYINSNTLRAGYPESKRCGEALCQAYIKQYDIDVVVARLTRSYGPTMLKSDTKAISQFINKALNNEDIVLKSEGKQYYSFLYMSDSVSGLLKVLLTGEKGEAYNISDEASDITLKDLATLIATACHKKVIFELPDEVEKAGFSKATKARLDNAKLTSLGWQAHYDIASGVKRTIKILKEVN